MLNKGSFIYIKKIIESLFTSHFTPDVTCQLVLRPNINTNVIFWLIVTYKHQLACVHTYYYRNANIIDNVVK